MLPNSAHVLMKKGKRGAAAYIHAECSNNSSEPKYLYELLDILLDPRKNIDDWENLDWIKWLIAGGKTPDEFSSIVRAFDNATTCGLVWTPKFVAYRCRTCGISPCMSLCTDCFKKGNHECHDFNMFLSQAGGACDCGDTSVMKQEGFCNRHGPNKKNTKGTAPETLMCVAEAMMPRVILRLLFHLRDCSSVEGVDVSLQETDVYVQMLLDFNNMGALMRRVITSALTNPQKYKALLDIPNDDDDSVLAAYLRESQYIYELAVTNLPNPEAPPEYQNSPSLQRYLVHHTFLDELVFWTVKFEFPQKIVCLLLNMLPDPKYKEALTRAFVLHYSRISMMLERTTDPDTLSNRVVHVSVQLFSNKDLALKMTEELHLLHVMVINLKYMMSKILVPSVLHNSKKNTHQAVDCSKNVMKGHCYWPLVSDLNNVLSHKAVAIKFMTDDTLLDIWFSFLQMFQGMNINLRELQKHVEYEPNTYYAAFSAELEANAYPMWSMVTHLTDQTTVNCTKRVLTTAINALQDWFAAIGFDDLNINDANQMTFHLPLHRYFAVFLCQAVKMQKVTLNEVLPSTNIIQKMIMHPLRVQVAFYEILSNLWIRNGLQIKGQAMTYIQCNFCNSMVDADIYLLQVCATRIEPQTFIETVINKFHTVLRDWLSLSTADKPYYDSSNGSQAPAPSMLECCLTFLASIVSIRANLGLSDNELNRLEMVTLLCMGDRTHSQLMELMPERCGTSQHQNFEKLIEEVADFKAPNLEASGVLQQRMYVPKASVWEQNYDPLHLLLRAVYRRDFRISMHRFTDYAMQNGKLSSNQTPWPPFREPVPCDPAYEDPRKVLKTKIFHAIIYIILYKAVNKQIISEQVMALAVYLLEMAVVTCEKTRENACNVFSHTPTRYVQDMDLRSWYETDCLPENLRTIIGRVTFASDPEVVPTGTVEYSADVSDIEWDDSDADNDDLSDMSDGGGDGSNTGSNNNAVACASTTVATTSGTGSANNSDLARIRQQNQSLVPHTGNVVALQNFNYATNRVLALEEGEMAIVPEQNIVEFQDGIDDEDIDPNEYAVLALLPPPPPPMSDSSTVSEGERDADVNMAVALPDDTSTGSVDEISRQPSTSVALMPSSPSTSQEVAIAPSSCKMKHFMPIKKQRPPEPTSCEINESIISLLLRLHSLLSGVQDSFDLDKPTKKSADNQTFESRIGDGPFFIGKVLHKIAALDQQCAENIREMRQRLWPKANVMQEEDKEKQEKEERRKRAQERQERLMAEFKSRQKQFMENVMTDPEEESKMEWEEEESKSFVKKLEYKCIICNQTSPSTDENPMGYVSLIQSTSVLGLQRPNSNRTKLPISDAERCRFSLSDRFGNEFDSRVYEMERNFDSSSWLMSVSLGWEGGVHVQTCGHIIHLDCLKTYLRTVRAQQQSNPQQNPPIDGRIEFQCPLCWQLANSVLPFSPQLDDCTQVIRSKPHSPNVNKMDILNFLQDSTNPDTVSTASTNLNEAMRKCMEDMTNCTLLKFKQKVPSPSHQSLMAFVLSIARTNLEIEIIQRGGTLLTPNVPSTSTAPSPALNFLPKRDFIVAPLMHVLSSHVRVIAMLGRFDPSKIWKRLTGILDQRPQRSPRQSPSPDFTLANPVMPPSFLSQLIPGQPTSSADREVPMLVCDPTALLIQIVLFLPLHLDQSYFTTVVKVLYNLLYYQVLAKLSCKLPPDEREQILSAYHVRRLTVCHVTEDIRDTLGFVIESLSQHELYIVDMGRDIPMPSTSSSNDSISYKLNKENPINYNVLETQLQSFCVPFLRVAALLRHHLYKHPLPEIADIQSEFLNLVYYLELVSPGMEMDYFNASVALSVSPSRQMNIAETWFNEYSSFITRAHVTAQTFLADQHSIWYPPKLLELPRDYEKIFGYYHKKMCRQCNSVPAETSICLLCGTVICLKQNCCKIHNVCEAVQHSMDCGGGTGIFLVVTSTLIIVIRGRRACGWGSLYLDEFDEEDRDLKRGKPLYLSEQRYQLLERQWLAHRFEHTKKGWFWHANGL